MARPNWKIVLFGGIAAAIAAAPFGVMAQYLVFTLGFLLGAIGLVLAVLKSATNHRLPWFMIAAGALFFFVSAVAKVAFPSQQDTPTSGMTTANMIYVAAYSAVTLGIFKLARLRSNDKDPTNLIDAIILTTGIAIVTSASVMVPMLKNPGISPDTKLVNVVFDCLDFALFLVFSRLMIGPGMRNTSYRLLSMIPISILLSDQLIALSQAQIVFPGELVLTLLIPPIGCAAGVAAALHPSMVRITEPADVEIAVMTKRRFVLMTLAVVVPPLCLFIDPRSYWLWLVPAWLGMAALVMVRFSGLLTARERVAKLDKILSDASAKLVSATSQDDVYKAVTVATTDLIQRYSNRSALLLVMASEGRWELAASNLPLPQREDIAKLQPETMEGLIGGAADVQQLTVIPAPLYKVDDLSNLVIAPLISQNKLRGAFLIYTDEKLPSIVVETIGTLATHVALALEAASLSADLHRRRSDRRFRALVENSSDAIFVLTQDGDSIFASPSAERMLRSAGESSNVFQAIHPSDRAAFVALVKNAQVISGRSQTLECRVLDQLGPARWIDVTTTDMSAEPEVGGIVVNAHDITERKQLENDLRHRVLHDDLTGIPNRVMLRERADHALSTRRDDSNLVALLFVDLNDFKTVNDGLGHAAGDEILTIVAFRINNFVRGQDTAARLGGDEFAVLLQGVASVPDVENIANRLLSIIQQPIDFHDRQIELKSTIGIYVAQDGDDSGTLLRNSDVALHDAKQQGKGAAIAFFDESMYLNAIERLDLRGDLAHAVERNELVAYYQPLVSLQKGTVAGFEALVRWMHPERGLVNPNTFIPIAEETGLIVEVGKWVLQEASRQLAHWKQLQPELQLTMSVNISPRQLDEPDIVETVADIIQRTSIDPHALTLELTETARLDDPVTRDRLRELGSLGVGIAADDFGSGFASYSALQELPFTVVKIDRSLIMGLDTNFQKANVQLRSIVEMAHSTGLQVVAEGIEDPRQRDLLTAMGCDRGQGYLFGRPSPAPAAEEFVTGGIFREHLPL